MPSPDGPEITADDLRAVAHRALAVSHPPVMRYLPAGRVEVRDGVVMSAFVDLPGPIFNKATAFGPTPPEKVFAIAEAFFGGVPYGVMLDAETARPVEDAMRARGWILADEEPGMTLRPITAPPPAPAELTICRVADAAGLRDFWTLGGPILPEQAAAADPATNLMRYFNPSLACALDPDIALFVGYVDGRPVTSAALYRVEEIADIGAVATLPAYRRRGYGAAMTWAAVAEGVARGCSVAVLRATEMGYPVYRRMGFTTVCTIRIYVPPAAPGDPETR